MADLYDCLLCYPVSKLVNADGVINLFYTLANRFM